MAAGISAGSLPQTATDLVLTDPNLGKGNYIGGYICRPLKDLILTANRLEVFFDRFFCSLGSACWGIWCFEPVLGPFGSKFRQSVGA
jgi:hypothetical protein